MDGVRHTWQSYVVLVREGIGRDELLRNLRKKGIEAGIGTYAVSAQPHYAGPIRALPNSCWAYERSLSFPLHTRMFSTDVEEVAACLDRTLAK